MLPGRRGIGFLKRPARISGSSYRTLILKIISDVAGFQEDVILDDHLTKFASGGEQAGKSEGTSMDFTDSVVSFLGEYQSAAGGEVAWIVADSYELTRVEYENTSLWLSHLFPKIKVSKRVDPGEIIIDIPGNKKPSL